jgi:hypothetical protein
MPRRENDGRAACPRGRPENTGTASALHAAAATVDDHERNLQRPSPHQRKATSPPGHRSLT